MFETLHFEMNIRNNTGVVNQGWKVYFTYDSTKSHRMPIELTTLFVQIDGKLLSFLGLPHHRTLLKT